MINYFVGTVHDILFCWDSVWYIILLGQCIIYYLVGTVYYIYYFVGWVYYILFSWDSVWYIILLGQCMIYYFVGTVYGIPGCVRSPLVVSRLMLLWIHHLIIPIHTYTVRYLVKSYPVKKAVQISAIEHEM